MHFTNLLLGSAFTLGAVASVCDSGLYKALAPLSSYPPAQSLCAQRFPRSTKTVTAPGSIQLTVTITVTTEAKAVRRAEATRASTSSAQATISTTTASAVVNAAGRRSSSTTPGSTRTMTTSQRTTTPQASSPPTTRATNPITSTTQQTSLRTSTRDSREAAWSSLSAQAGAILSTFCSCANPPVTVTTFSQLPPTTITTTTTTIPPTTPPPSSPPTPVPTCGIACEWVTIIDTRGAPECQPLKGSGCGFCAVDALQGYRGVCARCAGYNQVCNADSDCCDPTHVCGAYGSGYGWCFPRNAKRSGNLEIYRDLEENSVIQY